MQKTTTFARKEQFGKNGDLQHKWYCVDATDKTLGRLSSEIAKILQGKHKPYYTPNVDTGDYVIVINANKIRLSSNKIETKTYYHHTGYPGGLKQATAKEILAKNPADLLSHAIKGMLPKNKLSRQVFTKLKIYNGSEHLHQSNQPETLTI